MFDSITAQKFVQEVEKANKLKESELELRRVEISISERKNSILERHYESMEEIERMKCELKDSELKALARKVFAMEKANEIAESE